MLESIERLRSEISDDIERTCGSSTSVRSERVLSALDEIEHEISGKYIALNRRGTTAFCGECGFGGWKERAEEYKDEAAKLLRDVLHVAPCYSPWDVTESTRIISEHYMPLPVDADGVPIQIGDKMMNCACPPQDCCKFEVAAIGSHGVFDGDGEWYDLRHCRHVKPRTMRDILFDFMRDCETSPLGNSELVEKYEAELRDLLYGDEECSEEDGFNE